MHYTIYKITNLYNGKIYIGRHSTTEIDDGYMGSSIPLSRAIDKHGKESFSKEILYDFDNEQEMFDMEAALVTEGFVARNDVYNLAVGGAGTCNFRNPATLKKAQENGKIILAERRKDKNWVAKVSKKRAVAIKKYYEDNEGHFTGRSHTEETKKRMAKSAKGKHVGNKNSQYGTMWITNEKENRKIRKGESIPKGWEKGRKIKYRSVGKPG